MKIEIDFSSFRFKIIIILVAVITTMSFFSFYTYNYYLTKKIYKNAEDDMVSVLYFLRDQIIAIHDGRIIKPCLRELDKNRRVLQSYLINADGDVKYPDGFKSFGRDSLDLKTLFASKEDVTMRTFYLAPNPYSRAVIRLNNRPTCYACHSSAIKTIGYVVVDFSMHKQHNTVAFAKTFSLIFTIIMVLLILGFVLIFHYKIVRNSLAKFQAAINLINQGNLSERIKIPKSTELGKLGKSFNQMVEHFQQTQNELYMYHQKELRSSQKLASVGEMSARLAHEIRNPITGIANAIEIIIDETKEEQNKPVLEEIRRQVNRVNKAVSNLLNYSRTVDLDKQPGDINDIIKSVVFFLENHSTTKNIKYSVTLDPDLPFFAFDHEKIENVLMNLGLNSIQAIINDGIISYYSLFIQSNNMVRITVSDNGKGIPEDKIQDIFKPFFTTRTEGTGLGLAIAKEITELHDGELRVENNPGKGCSFHIFLPVIHL